MLLYHRVPPNITGRFLSPLNLLRESEPAIFAEAVKKYEGREFVLKERVLNLDCLWNDVPHFSPVHPAKIYQILSDLGFSSKPSRWFAINPEAHGFSPSNTSIFLYPERPPGDFAQYAEDFIPFSLTELPKLQTVPEGTAKYFAECTRDGKNPLLFHLVPHILHRGELEISKLQVIDI